MKGGFLTALAASLDGCRKQAAHAVWPESTLEQAESRLSRVLKGELNPPPDLVDFALQASGRDQLVSYVQARAARDPSRMRAQAVELLEELQAGMDAVFARLREADEIEGQRAPLKVETLSPRRRGAA